MKRVSCFLAVVLCLNILSLFSSCTAGLREAELRVVSMNFAGYDFACEVVGRDNERVSVELLAGGDAHSFNPTFQDIAKIESCDLFIYVGGESDAAVESLLAACGDVRVLKMIDCVDLLAEETEEAYEQEEHEHDHEEGEHEHGYDEHIWTSPINAALLVDRICDELALCDPDYADAYRANAAAYQAELAALDDDFKALFASCEEPTLVFGDRFPFRYFAEHYDLSVFSAFPGCSTASEPSPKTVTFLVDKVRRENISTVFYIEGSTHSVADRIASEAGAVSALLHSCHHVSAEEIANGATYLSLMRRNLTTLRTALLNEP